MNKNYFVIIISLVLISSTFGQDNVPFVTDRFIAFKSNMLMPVYILAGEQAAFSIGTEIKPSKLTSFGYEYSYIFSRDEGKRDYYTHIVDLRIYPSKNNFKHPYFVGSYIKYYKFRDWFHRDDYVTESKKIAIGPLVGKKFVFKSFYIEIQGGIGYNLYYSFKELYDDGSIRNIPPREYMDLKAAIYIGLRFPSKKNY